MRKRERRYPVADPNPITNEELFNVLTVGGVNSPGVVTISDNKFVVDWDVKEAKGQTGATTTMNAVKLKRFTATFYLCDQEEFDAWPDFDRLLRSTVIPSPKAISVYHPDVARQGIDSAVLEEIGGVVHDKRGGQTYAVKMIEYRPPRKSGGSPKGSSSKASSAANDPNAAALAELRALTQQYKDTPWG